MKKIYKISKYFLVSIFVIFVSLLVGQKHSSDYTFSLPEASADIPTPTDSGIIGGGDGAASDSGASASDDGGTDGASSDGPGDGACAA